MTDAQLDLWAPEVQHGPGDGRTWPARLWRGVVCGHCGSDRYGVPASGMADRCFDCGRTGYSAKEPTHG